MDDIHKKQNDVKKILLTPIKLGEEISLENNCIFTKQTYKGSFDPDMSAVAVGFYEIIYGLKILDGKGYLLNKEFAGDTMCSFNTIVNLKNKGQVLKIGQFIYRITIINIIA